MATDVDYFSNESLRGDLKGMAVRGGAMTLASQSAKFVLTLGSMMVLARLLAPGDFGLVAMVTVVSGFAVMFKDMGLSTATVQRDQINHPQVSMLFWINSAISLLLGLIVGAMAWPIAWFYGEPRLVAITLAMAVGFPLSGLSLQHQALLRRQMRFASLAMIDVGAGAVGVVVGIASAIVGKYHWPEQNYFALVIAQLATGVAAVVGSWLVCRWRPDPPRRGTGVRPMIHFGLNLTGSNIVNYIGRNLDNLLIGKFFGPTVLGLYDRGYSLLVMPQQRCLSPLGTAMIPALSRIGMQPERFRTAFNAIHEKVAMLTIPLVIAMICTADWLVRVALGPGWDEAAIFFIALGPVAITQAAAATCNWGFVAAGKTAEQLHCNLVNNFVIIVAIVVGVCFSPLAVALVYSLSGVFIRTPILFWWVGRVTPLRTSQLYTLTIPFLIAGAIEGCAALLARRWIGDVHPIVALGTVCAISLIVYAGALLLFPQGRRVIKETVLLYQHLFRRARPTLRDNPQ